MEKRIAVIFDMDGVIVDNGDFHVKAYAELCKRYNLEFSEEDFKVHKFGKVNEEVLSELFGRELVPDEIVRLAGEKEMLYREIYRPELKAMPGLIDLMKALKDNKIPVGVATSAPAENVEFILGGLDIGHYVDVVVDDSMVNEGKPDPEVYLKAAALLETEPGNCIVFEDSLSGTMAAYHAGAKVIALTTTLQAADHKYAHHTLSDFTSISVQELLQMIS